MSTPKAPADPFDARLVRKLADILNDTGLSEIEVERGDLKIRVVRQVSAPAAVYAAAPGVAILPFIKNCDAARVCVAKNNESIGLR